MFVNIKIRIMNDSQLQIAKQIKDISLDNAIKDLFKLKDIDTTRLTIECRVGNTFLDFFMFPFRLNTISRKGFNFYSFVNDTEYHARPYIKNLLDYQANLLINEITKLYRIYSLHCGTISIFKPLRAIEVFKYFKPRSVLDPCMGWGGRLLGACICGVHCYTGIDLNIELKEPYGRMVSLLNGVFKPITLIKLHFCDAVGFDYSSLDYDLVLTSPPYFNIELYPGTNKLTKTEWINNFYNPLFKATYAGLALGGWFCINVNPEIYLTVLNILLGNAHIILPMSNKVRPSNNVGEFIYCWRKGT